MTGPAAIDGTPFARGVWLVADRDPDRPAVVDPAGATVTFGELVDMSHRLAHGLRRAGLGPGSTVAALLPNGVEMVALYLAAIESGLYFTPVNFHLVPDEAAYVLTNSDSGVLVAHERFAELASRASDRAELWGDQRFAVGAIDGFAPVADLAAEGTAGFLADAVPGEVVAYTSGTTGRPKGVRRPLGNGDVLASLDLFGGLVLGPDADEGGVHLVCAPLYFRGPSIPAAVALHRGHTLVLMDGWTPEGMLDEVARHRVTSTYLVPTMIHRLLGLPADRRDAADVTSLRYVLHSSAPCPVAEKRALLDWWGPVLHETYGGTEGGGTYVGPREWLDRPGTVGRPWPGAAIHVLDDDGRPCPPGVEGTVFIRPTSPDFAYHGDPDKTAAAKRGRLHTLGDIGRLDADGYLFLSGRRTDLILSGGVNVYPAEVEAALLAHADVEDVAVFGLADPEWGERVHAVVVPRPSRHDHVGFAAELESHCRTHLAGHKRPRSIEVVPGLPRTSAGKLNKQRLQAEREAVADAAAPSVAAGATQKEAHRGRS